MLSKEEWDEIRDLKKNNLHPFSPDLTKEQKEFLEKYYMFIPSAQREKFIRRLFPYYTSSLRSFHRLIYEWSRRGYLNVEGMRKPDTNNNKP